MKIVIVFLLAACCGYTFMQAWLALFGGRRAALGLLVLLLLTLLVTGCEGITYPSRPMCCEWRVTVLVNGDSTGVGTVRGDCGSGDRIGLRNPVAFWRSNDCR